jgi:glycosyltransferase involved in cell wall biosynthesis
VARPFVLVDATPLRATSGFRGIGRYVRDLLYGLELTRSEWQGEVSVAAIEDMGLGGRFVVNEDLIAAADAAFAARGTRKAGLTAARRWVLGKAAGRVGASLLHVTEALGTPLGCPVQRLVTCHDMIELVYSAQYLRNRVRAWSRRHRERVRYAHADHVVAISQRTATDVVAIAGADPAHVHVVPHGIDLDSFQGPNHDDERVLGQLGLCGVRYAFYVGGADWRKNAEGMVGALRAARESTDLELVWAGALAPKGVRRVERLARAAGVSDHVRLLGYVNESQLPALYRGSVAHLFLSRLEGFGLSVAEAMAAGCPVVVARGSQSDEIVGDAGIVVDPDDHAAAGRALSSLAGARDARSRYEALGRERARRFDRRRMARDYAKLYAELG